MEILCRHCKSKLRIAEEKLPSGQTVSFKCPKCKNTINIDTKARTAAAPRAGSLETIVDEVSSGTYDPSEKPFDYLEAGVRTALLCEHDPPLKQKMRAALEQMNYHIVEAASARNALKYMRFHVYDLVVLDETFDGAGPESNHVLQYLAQLSMNIRRNIFVALLGNGFRTMDNMTAFNKSVNLVVNPKDLDDMGKILKGALAEHEEFYRIFRESMKKTGRA
ncbi:MAG: zinc-ribbon domain-containing protein [Desulfobacterales bacterium]|nr:zinc-ribbon domain-containing protein [Desulfobacterales bacterium]